MPRMCMSRVCSGFCVATVYASVAVVSGDDKSGAWLEDDDTMAWGDDKIPIQMRGA